jgi:transcriptional regulator with PAS, ATPase and Fis domain
MSERHDIRSLIIGESDVMRELLTATERFAGRPTPVMFYGETGTGKELFARLLHSLSPRKNGRFVAVNCAAIPETLIESELFGYERGAFTGADQRRIGLWERANGGALFLDEVGDLSPLAQTKVLRALQERVIRRVGGTEDIAVDARIIAATNVNLLEGIRARTFREDLYYRLHILHVTIPPLRKRGNDILLILDYLIRKLCEEWDLGRPPSISQAAKNKLLAYPWPGNIREVENVVTRTLSMCPGARELHAADFRLLESEVEIPPDILSIFVAKGTLYHMRMQAEAAIVRWALTESEENQTLAARRLGMHRNTLIEKMRTFRIRGY